MKECAKVKRFAWFVMRGPLLWVMCLHSRDCRRMNWQVLDWNTKAQDLYKRMGARMLKEWVDMDIDKCLQRMRNMLMLKLQHVLRHFVAGQAECGQHLH